MEPTGKKGTFTFRTAAVLFVLSAVFELFSITSDVPLFGEIRSGMGITIYHLVYIGLFGALGVGLWNAKQWGYPLAFVTIIFYTIDKLQFLLSQKMRDVFVTQLQDALEPYMPGIPKDFIMQVLILMSVIFLFCWWGFAIYIYLRRDYFKSL